MHMLLVHSSHTETAPGTRSRLCPQCRTMVLKWETESALHWATQSGLQWETAFLQLETLSPLQLKPSGLQLETLSDWPY